MIKLKHGEKLYKVLKPFFWSPLYNPKRPGSGMTQPGTYLGLSELGGDIRAKRGEVERVEDPAGLALEHAAWDEKGAKAIADKAKAREESRKKGLAAQKTTKKSSK